MSVVDSCGWLEYFANGCNAEFFVPILAATDPLIVPSRTAALNAARTFLLGAGALRGRLIDFRVTPLSREGGARVSSVRRAGSWASGAWVGNAMTLNGNTFRIDSVVMRKAANPSPLRGSIATRGLRPGRGLVLVIT